MCYLAILLKKLGKKYEWQSFEDVKPTEIKKFNSVIKGMMQCNVQVYFINDDNLFDRIANEKNNRAPILRKLISENQKRNINIKNF